MATKQQLITEGELDDEIGKLEKNVVCYER